MRGVTHIAGLSVLLGNRGRQLCAWCGEVLFEAIGNESVTKMAEGSPSDARRPWPQGAFVEVVRDGLVTGYHVLPDTFDGDIPMNSCGVPTHLRTIRGGRA